MSAPKADTDNRPAKNRGELCFFCGCQEPDPRSPVIWECSNGHRLEILYCPGHGTEMMTRAIREAGRIGPLCKHCSDLMLPVTEGL